VTLVLTDVRGERVALHVERVSGQQQIYVKPVPELLARVRALAGLTSSGTGGRPSCSTRTSSHERAAPRATSPASRRERRRGGAGRPGGPPGGRRARPLCPGRGARRLRSALLRVEGPIEARSPALPAGAGEPCCGPRRPRRRPAIRALRGGEHRRLAGAACAEGAGGGGALDPAPRPGRKRVARRSARRARELDAGRAGVRAILVLLPGGRPRSAIP
jgi:hypothetical protein